MSEGRLDSEITSEADCCRHQVATEDITVCERSAAYEMAPSSVTCSRESADEMQTETDLNLRQSEFAVSDTVDGKTHETNSRCTSIDNLPDEILIEILSYMPFSELVDVAQKVCSRWKRLSQDVELWTDKEYHIAYWNYGFFDNSKADTTDQEAVQFFRNAPNLRKVTMHRGAGSRVFRALCTRCHRLSELRLHAGQKLSYSMLKQLAEKCSRIQTLRIPTHLLKSEKCSEAVSRLQHLRVLELEDHHPQIPVLRPLADGCPQLTEVDFGIVTLNMDDLRYFLTAKKNTLKSVCIKWAMVGKRCVLPLLTVCAENLERLQLHDYDIPRDEAREAFTALGNLKNLRELRTPLADPLPHGAAALAFMSGGLPKLRLLDLGLADGLDDLTVTAVSRGCPALRELVVRGAEQLSDAAFSQIYRLKHLERLDVSRCKGLGGALMPCLTRLPRLHTLVMEELEFSKLQPGLSSILELSGLRCLTLNYSTVTGVPFDKFSGKLVSLRELYVQWCRGNPEATDGLTEQMPDLKIEVCIEPEEPDVDAEDHENDAEIPDEENEENPVLDNEGEVQDEAQNEEQNEDSDRDSGSRGFNECDSENVIWDESSIHILFVEEI